MRAVILDITGVLIGWKPNLLYRRLVPFDDLSAYLLAEMGRAPWEDEPVRDGAVEEGLRRLTEGCPWRGQLFVRLHDNMMQDMLRRMGAIATLMERLSAQGIGLFGATDLEPPALARVSRVYPSASCAASWSPPRSGCRRPTRRCTNICCGASGWTRHSAYTWTSPRRTRGRRSPSASPPIATPGSRRCAVSCGRGDSCRSRRSFGHRRYRRGFPQVSVTTVCMVSSPSRAWLFTTATISAAKAAASSGGISSRASEAVEWNCSM